MVSPYRPVCSQRGASEENAYPFFHDSCHVAGKNAFCMKGMPVMEGRVQGKHARVLRYTGCKIAIVLRDSIEDGGLTRRTTSISFIDGSMQHLAPARIRMDTPYIVGEITVSCIERLVYHLGFRKNCRCQSGGQSGSPLEKSRLMFTQSSEEYQHVAWISEQECFGVDRHTGDPIEHQALESACGCDHRR